jgi:predicted deacetylase
MSTWLDPVRAALEQIDRPSHWFFRDDDAGWADDRLEILLNYFTEWAVPLDLAVIPTELRDDLADALLRRYADRPKLLGLHQHGYSHANHEITGRKCEFGASRSALQQSRDIEQGAKLLCNKLGRAIDAIFTPPWNRCSSATVAALQAFDFRALSRDVSAAPLDLGDLTEIPVCVDWSKYRDGEQINHSTLAVNIAAAANRSTVGIMLHHAVMTPADFTALGEFLALLKRKPHAKCVPMRALFATATQLA